MEVEVFKVNTYLKDDHNLVVMGWEGWGEGGEGHQ